MKFNLTHINAMIPADFEQLCEQGEEYRRKLSDAVVGLITTPAGWQVNAEYRREFGGLFPVQIRFQPRDESAGGYGMCLCSPDELLPGWLIVLVSDDARYANILHQSEHLEPDAISTLLSRVAGMQRLNCSSATVNALLGQGVAA